MRQSIDLNRKKEQRGAVVTVMFHGSVWRFDDSRSALLAQSCALMPLTRAQHVPILEAETVALASHCSLHAEWFPASIIGGFSSADVNQSKISPWATNPRLSAFQVEGISNSSCGYAACTPTTKKSEQRCCAAA